MTPRHAIVFSSVALSALLVPWTAQPGQVHYELVDLDEVLRSSPIVVLARQAQPPAEAITVPLGPSAQPFSYVHTHWEVVEWLRPARDARDSERITVSSLDADSFARHVSIYLHGIDESPILPAYPPEHPPAEGEAMILFLHRGALLDYDPATHTLSGRDDTLVPTFQGAVEGQASRDAVAARIAQAPSVSDRLELLIAVPGADDRTREGIALALEARYPQESALSWTVVDTRPLEAR